MEECFAMKYFQHVLTSGFLNEKQAVYQWFRIYGGRYNYKDSRSQNIHISHQFFPHPLGLVRTEGHAEYF